MIRKFFAALVALTLVVGGLFAEDIKGVFKKFEDGKVTIDVDGKEKTYKVDENATMKIKGKDGTEKEVKLVDSLKRAKDGSKGTFTVEKDVVTKFQRDRGK
jgi:hypothetical protein